MPLPERLPIGTTGRTGEVCPEAGLWKVQDTPHSVTAIYKGRKFLPFEGREVTWVLVQYPFGIGLENIVK